MSRVLGRGSGLRKLQNLNESEMEEFIIDRSKSPQEIETQIGRLAGKFQELEQKFRFHREEKNEFREFEDSGNRLHGSDDSMEVGIPPIINYHQEKRRKKADPREVEIDLVGKYPLSNMLRSNLGESNEANAV